jgi:hypothetical protein
VKALLLKLEQELRWSNLRRQDKVCADLMAKLAPVFVTQALKLSKTRHIQAQSTAKRNTK